MTDKVEPGDFWRFPDGDVLRVSEIYWRDGMELAVMASIGDGSDAGYFEFPVAALQRACTKILRN